MQFDYMYRQSFSAITRYEYCLTKRVLTHIKLDLPNMNIKIVIIKVPCYTINIKFFKLILQPGNTRFGNWFLCTAIYPENHCSLFENIRCSRSKRRSDIRFKSKTQKYIHYVRHYSNDYRLHRLLHHIFYFIVIFILCSVFFTSKSSNVPIKCS
jgi:hypothetical protein